MSFHFLLKILIIFSLYVSSLNEFNKFDEPLTQHFLKWFFL